MTATVLRWIQIGLFVSGAFLLGTWIETRWAARNYQSQAARVLDRWRTGAREVGGRPDEARAVRARAQARETGVVGSLSIPRLRLSAMVGEGIDDRTLDRAVGHVPGSAFPGEAGNVSLAGHRDTFFKKLARIRHGDRIRLDTPDGSFEYRVVHIGVVPPHSVGVLQDRGDQELTLVTCYPFRAIGPAPNRFIVRARASQPRDQFSARI